MACRGNASRPWSNRFIHYPDHESSIPTIEQNRTSEEPYALIGLVRVCGGAAGKPAALPGRALVCDGLADTVRCFTSQNLLNLARIFHTPICWPAPTGRVARDGFGEAFSRTNECNEDTAPNPHLTLAPGTAPKMVYGVAPKAKRALAKISW